MDQLVQGVLGSVLVLDPRPAMYDVAENAILHFQLKPMDAMHIGAAVDFGQLASPDEPRWFASYDAAQANAAERGYRLAFPPPGA